MALQTRLSKGLVALLLCCSSFSVLAQVVDKNCASSVDKKCQSCKRGYFFRSAASIPDRACKRGEIGDIAHSMEVEGRRVYVLEVDRQATTMDELALSCYTWGFKMYEPKSYTDISSSLWFSRGSFPTSGATIKGRRCSVTSYESHTYTSTDGVSHTDSIPSDCVGERFSLSDMNWETWSATSTSNLDHSRYRWIISTSPTTGWGIWGGFKGSTGQTIMNDFQGYECGSSANADTEAGYCNMETYVPDAHGVQRDENQGLVSVDGRYETIVSALRSGRLAWGSSFCNPQQEYWTTSGSWDSTKASISGNTVQMYPNCHLTETQFNQRVNSAFYVMCESERDCQDGPQIAHMKQEGDCTSKQYRSGQQCTFKCEREDTFERFPSGKATCMDGSWGTPKCRSSCKALNIPGANTDGCAAGQHGSGCVFSCTNGYQLGGTGVECFDETWMLSKSTPLSWNACSIPCGNNCNSCDDKNTCISCKADSGDQVYSRSEGACLLSCTNGKQTLDGTKDGAVCWAANQRSCAAERLPNTDAFCPLTINGGTCLTACSFGYRTDNPMATCRNGAWDHTACGDADTCSQDPCGDDNDCANMEGGYSCQCDNSKGWYFDANNKPCQRADKRMVEKDLDDINDQAKSLESTSTSGSGSSMTGDPHVMNLRGETFDVMRSGKHSLVCLPRGLCGAENDLHAQATVARLRGDVCESAFVQDLTLEGKWVGDPVTVSAGTLGEQQQFGLQAERFYSPEDLQKQGLTRQAARVMTIVAQRAPRETISVDFGSVKISVEHVSHPHLNFLNVHVQGLLQQDMEVGGLLGLDSHKDAATAPIGCKHKVRLYRNPEVVASQLIGN